MNPKGGPGRFSNYRLSNYRSTDSTDAQGDRGRYANYMTFTYMSVFYMSVLTDGIKVFELYFSVDGFTFWRKTGET